MAPTLPDVPIVGQVIKAHEGLVLVTATCQCRPDNTPMLINGVQTAAVCRACRNVYAIVRVEFDRAQGHQAVSAFVGLIGKADALPNRPPTSDN